MCGRYKLSAKSGSLYEFFDIHGETPFEFVPHYNIAPTQPIAVIRTPRRVELLRWGIKIPNPRAGGFNVRVESLGALALGCMPWSGLTSTQAMSRRRRSTASARSSMSSSV